MCQESDAKLREYFETHSANAIYVKEMHFVDIDKSYDSEDESKFDASVITELPVIEQQMKGERLSEVDVASENDNEMYPDDDCEDELKFDTSVITDKPRTNKKMTPERLNRVDLVSENGSKMRPNEINHDVSVKNTNFNTPDPQRYAHFSPSTLSMAYKISVSCIAVRKRYAESQIWIQMWCRNTRVLFVKPRECCTVNLLTKFTWKDTKMAPCSRVTFADRNFRKNLVYCKLN